MEELNQMYDQEIKPYRSYLLRYQPEQAGAVSDPPDRLFIVEEISGKQQREFQTLEQVMDFLLAELLDQLKEVPANSQ
jgi:hypothetical protein